MRMKLQQCLHDDDDDDHALLAEFDVDKAMELTSLIAAVTCRELRQYVGRQERPSEELSN